MTSNNTKKDILFLICNVVIPLLIGAYIYIYISKDSYFGNFVRHFISIPTNETKTLFRFLMKNWGGDFLWAYALFFALCFSMYPAGFMIKKSSLYTIACSVFVELLQLIQVDFIKCGTFDVLDIIIELFAVLVGVIVFKSYMYLIRKDNKYE